MRARLPRVPPGRQGSIAVSAKRVRRQIRSGHRRRAPHVRPAGGGGDVTADVPTHALKRLLGNAGAQTRSQQLNTDQQMSFRNRWSSSTSSRIASGSWSRCHRHSRRPALSPSPSRCGSTYGLDRVGGRAELVGGDVCDGRGLAGSVRGMPCCTTEVSGRGHRMAGRRASLSHGDCSTRPGSPEFDRVTRPRVLGLSRLEEVEDVLRARCRPQGQELVIRVGEVPPRRIVTKRGSRFFGRITPSTPFARICSTRCRALYLA
jgi:hypothetical protein